MGFTPNPRFTVEIAKGAAMRRFLAGVARDAAREIEGRLPHPSILGGIEVTDETQMTGAGWEGEVRVEGPGWHLWEYGTVNHGAQPAIRPGAQAALSRYGGRLGESR